MFIIISRCEAADTRHRPLRLGKPLLKPPSIVTGLYQRFSVRCTFDLTFHWFLLVIFQGFLLVHSYTSRRVKPPATTDPTSSDRAPSMRSGQLQASADGRSRSPFTRSHCSFRKCSAPYDHHW